MDVLKVATKTLQLALQTAIDGVRGVVDGIKTTTDSTKTGVDNLNTKQDSLLLKIQNGALKQNVAVFDKPGTYTWKCPDGVTAVVLKMFGAGGSGSAIREDNEMGYTAPGGGGGAFVNGIVIPVNPGQSYSLVVGKGGAPVTTPTNSGISFLVNGNAGGASSGFGITCPGGSGFQSNYGNAYPTGSQGFPGAHGIGNATGSTHWDPPHITPYGYAGFKRSGTMGTNYRYTAGGGGAGYGSGSSGMYAANGEKAAPGGGGGGVVGSGTNNNLSGAGGDGIIIIEY